MTKSNQEHEPRAPLVSRRNFLAVGASALAAAPLLRAQGVQADVRRALDAAGLRSAETIGGLHGGARRDDLPWSPIPSRAQLAWQRDELAMFLHFGVNTFSDREWGDGKEDPRSFNPDRLDAKQWARTAKAAGFKTLILTAKHHDGFCLWPTKTTQHSVASSPFRNGKGDVVREFVNGCRSKGRKVGLYCSPWDRNAEAYGDSPRYNDMYMAQLTELLTQYGRIDEVWFDGANGEGPNGRKQVYDWPRTFALVRKLQPEAVMFSDAGPDVRWIGNENGVAGETNWSRMNPDDVPYPGASGPNIIHALQHGDATGHVWRPGETDVSIRPGWFYHPAEDTKVKTAQQLVDLYFTSVGRNSKLLLNVPPSREGKLHDTDIARLLEMHLYLKNTFHHDLAHGKHAVWSPIGTQTATLEVDLKKPETVGIADLREDIKEGQSVAKYTLEGFDGSGWHMLSSGTTIGYRKLDTFKGVSVSRVKLTIADAVDDLRRVSLALHAPRM